MPIRKILVAADGSEPANRALGFAVERAQAAGAEVVVAFVVNRLAVAIATATPYSYADPAPLLEALDAEADVVLHAAEALVRKSGLQATAVKLDGAAAPQILAYARAAAVDAIVMGSHGRRGFERLAVGSTAEDVIRASHVPVFVITSRCERPHAAGKLANALVAVDGSPAGHLALDVACDLAAIEGTKLTLCTVVEPSGMHWDELDSSAFLTSELEHKANALLDAERQRAAALGAKAGSLVRTGDATKEIVIAAREAGADCIVIGTHGRAGIPRFILGSVAEGVLRSSHLPVCTVRKVTS